MTIDRNLPPEERSRLVNEMVDRLHSSGSGEEVLEAFEPLIRVEAGRLWRTWTWPPGWEWDDVLQECRVELLIMAKTWNGRTPFLTFVAKVYRWRVVNRTRAIRRHLQHELDYDHHLLVEIGPAAKDDPESLVLLAELWLELTPTQRAVMSVLFDVPLKSKLPEHAQERELLALHRGTTVRAIRKVRSEAADRARRWRDGQPPDRRYGPREGQESTEE